MGPGLRRTHDFKGMNCLLSWVVVNALVFIVHCFLNSLHVNKNMQISFRFYLYLLKKKNNQMLILPCTLILNNHDLLKKRQVLKLKLTLRRQALHPMFQDLHVEGGCLRRASTGYLLKWCPAQGGKSEMNSAEFWGNQNVRNSQGESGVPV